MRIGMHLPQFREDVDAGLLGGAARAAEEAGLDDVWVSDHVLLPAGSVRPPARFHDALTILTYAAAVTERVGLGTSVLVAPHRHPVVLAKAIASLDALSGGRAIAGIASGWHRQEIAAVGGDWRTRGAYTDETIAVCRALWSGEERYAGRFTVFEGMRLEPGPARIGGPPVWVGGNSDAGIARAARLGDAWHTTISDPGRLAGRIRDLRAAEAEAGRRPGEVAVSVRARIPVGEAAALVAALEPLGVVHLLVDLPGTDPGRFASGARALEALRG